MTPPVASIRARVTSVSVVGHECIHVAEARLLAASAGERRSVTAQFRTPLAEGIPIGYRIYLLQSQGLYFAELEDDASRSLGQEPGTRWICEHVHRSADDPYEVHRGEPSDRIRRYVATTAEELGMDAGFDRENENGCWHVWVRTPRGVVKGYPTPTDAPWALALHAVGLGSLDS